jgi:hypothetical protein
MPQHWIINLTRAHTSLIKYSGQTDVQNEYFTLSSTTGNLGSIDMMVFLIMDLLLVRT